MSVRSDRHRPLSEAGSSLHPSPGHRPAEAACSMSSDPVGNHFDRVAPDYDHWKEKAHRYYAALKTSLAEVVPPGSRVLEVGCATGDILESLRPAEGLGLDISPAMIARAADKHPALRFLVHDLMQGPIDERFDYVVAADVAEHVPD